MLFRATTKLDMANGHSVVTMWSAVSQVIDLSTLQRDIRPAVATNNFSMIVVMGPFQFLWSPYVIGQTIIFLPCDFYLLSSSSSFFPRLILAVGDWMSTILLHMAWP